jgi:hypothetical protein
MDELERLKKWKAELRRLGLNPRKAAEKLGITSGMAYAWHCGQRPVPRKRIEQLQQMQPQQ